MAKDLYLAVDVGTGSVRVAIVDAAGRLYRDAQGCYDDLDALDV